MSSYVLLCHLATPLLLPLTYLTYQGAEGVVAYARTDDGLERVGLLGQKLGVHAEVKLG